MKRSSLRFLPTAEVQDMMNFLIKFYLFLCVDVFFIPYGFIGFVNQISYFFQKEKNIF